MGEISMRTLNVLLLCCQLVVVLAAPAAAEPKGPNDEACSESQTGVNHKIAGKMYTCDSCTVLKCDTSGGQVSNCTKTTYWSNCAAAAAISNGSASVFPPTAVSPGGSSPGGPKGGVGG